MTETEPHAPKHWGRFNAAMWGALAGILLALAHALQHIFSSDVYEDVLMNTVYYFFGLAAAGALMFAIAAELRNRLVRVEHSTEPNGESSGN